MAKRVIIRRPVRPPLQTPATPLPTRIDLHVHLHDEPSGRVIAEKLDHLLTLVGAVKAQGQTLMASFQEVSDELDTIKAAIQSVKATGEAQVIEIAALKAQIAAGSPVTQEQLDSLDAKADSILEDLTPVTPEA